MAIIHTLLRFNSTYTWRALLIAAVACGAAAAASAQTSQSVIETLIIENVNEMRRNAKLAALKPDPTLSQIAREHSIAMMKAGKVTHESVLDGRKTPADRYARVFGKAADKIEELVSVVDPAFSDELLALDAHMQMNLKGASFAIAAATDVSTLGVGCAVGADGRVWITELFVQPAGRAGPAPPPQPVIATQLPPKTSPARPPDSPRDPQPGVTTKVPPKIELLPSADPPRQPQPAVPAKVPPKTSPARPPDPQVPAGPVIYEGTLSEELDADLRKPGYFGSARLLSLKYDRLRMEISPKDNDSVTLSPVVMERVLQMRDRLMPDYSYDWGKIQHVRYEWSFLPGRFQDGSNAGAAFITSLEKMSYATEEPGRPLDWKTLDVTKGLAEIQATSKVAEPKYGKSEYEVSWFNDFYRAKRMYVLKPVSTFATPPATTPPPETKTHDAFLTWYLGFSRLLQDSRDRINDARAVAATIAMPLENARREQQRLVRALAEAARARQAGKPTASTEITDRLTEKGRLLSEECKKYLDRLDAVSADAKSAQDKVMAEFNKGFDAYAGDDLPMWIRWREHFELIAESLPFELAIAASEDVRLREAVEGSETKTLPGSLRVKMARAMIARGELALAIDQLHRVLAVDPQNADAKVLLARAEIVVMKLSMQKAAGALGLARTSFNNLLDATGYIEHHLQPADWMPEATPDAVKLVASGIDWLFTEAWEKVTHTAINVMDQGTGRTVSEARALAAVEREYAGNFMAVPIMMRLREKGFTLEQMGRMDTAALKAAIPLNTAGGAPYTNAQVIRLGVAIKSALRFEDIAALKDMGMDVLDLKPTLDKPYLTPSDMVDTWVDEFGSMVVEQAILLALPMAQLSAGGATVTEFLGHITRFEKAVEWYGSTKTGGRILEGLKQYQDVQNALITAGTASSYTKFAALKGLEMMAMMMVEHYAVTLAEAKGGEPAAAVTAALSLLVTDLDLLTKWLAAGRVPTQTAVRIMATAIRQAEADVLRMEQGGATLKRLREMSRRRPAGQALPPADAAVVQRAEQLDAAFVPNGDPLHDSALVRAHLAEDASSGAASDAARVSQQFEGDLITKKTSIAVEVQRAEAARQKLAAARPAGANLPPRFAPKDAGSYEIPPEPVPGSAWAQAEQAQRDGDHIRAKDLYRTAYDNNELSEKLFRALDDRVVKAYEISKVPRVALGPKQPTSAEFTPGEVRKELVDNWDLKTPLNRSDKAVMSNVFNSANGDFILKEITIQKFPNMTADQRAAAEEALYRAADNEIVSSRLMDVLGIPSARAGAHVVMKEGKVESIRLLMRKIDGDELGDLNVTAEQLLQHADELSAQRAFSIIIRDYDRKLSNFMLGKDGRIYYIDAGLAKLIEPELLTNPDWVDRHFWEEGLGGLDHYFSRSFDEMKTTVGRNDTIGIAKYLDALKTNLVERSLTANGAQAMVRKIENLLAPENEAALLDLLINAYRETRGASKTAEQIWEMAEQTIKTMRIRQQRLPEVLKHLNERNGIPLPDEANPLKLLQFPTQPKPIARIALVEWRVAA